MRVMHGTACALVAAVAATCAQGSFIHFDINAIEVQAAQGFDGLTHTGELVLSAGADSTLNAISLDSSSQPMSGELGSLEGVIQLDGGVIAGGWLRFSADDGAEYLAQLVTGSGAVASQAGQGFRIDSLTSEGAFFDLVDGEMFAGVDIIDGVGLGDPVSIEGSILLHGFGPDASGFDGLVDLDVYATTPIPAPGAAAMGLLASGLAGARRRR